MTNKYFIIFISLFAFTQFISLAAGNVVLSIATLFFFYYLYKNRQSLSIISQDYRKYYMVIMIFLVTMLLSALGSGNIGEGLKDWFGGWIARILPFFIVTLAIREEITAKRILTCAVAGLTVGMVYILYQGITGVPRANGFFGHPMTFAGFLSMYIPMLLVCFLDERVYPKYRPLFGVLFFMSCIAVLFNGTRGAWLASIPGILFLLGYYARKAKAFVAVCLAILVLGGIGVTQYPPIVQRMETITNQNFQSNTERLLIWQGAWHMFKDHPVLGVGLGQYTKEYQHTYILPEAKERLLTHAHNNFIQMLAENGIVGFLGFVTMVGYFIIHSCHVWYKTKNPYALMMGVSIVALILQGMTEYNFGNAAVVKCFWITEGILLVLTKKWQESHS